jgi:hypothetical protein
MPRANRRRSNSELIPIRVFSRRFAGRIFFDAAGFLGFISSSEICHLSFEISFSTAAEFLTGQDIGCGRFPRFVSRRPADHSRFFNKSFISAV